MILKYPSRLGLLSWFVACWEMIWYGIWTNSIIRKVEVTNSSIVLLYHFIVLSYSLNSTDKFCPPFWLFWDSVHGNDSSIISDILGFAMAVRNNTILGTTLPDVLLSSPVSCAEK